jgi:DNA-binding HxlR family transcriptional regulator
MQAAPSDTGGGPGVTPTGCRVRGILERVGDKWSLFVISCLGDGPRRFTALKRSVDGISQRMLTVTLRGLERDGIVSRTMYPVMPPRVDYELTPLGRTLLDAVGALMTGLMPTSTRSTRPAPPTTPGRRTGPPTARH